MYAESRQAGRTRHSIPPVLLQRCHLLSGTYRVDDIPFRGPLPEVSADFGFGSHITHNPNRNKGESELYHIIKDPTEQKNLASKNPDILKQLKGKLNQWKATLPKEYTKSNDKN